MMNRTEIKMLLASRQTETFTIDPMHKNDIQRQQSIAIERCIKKALSSKKTVTVIVVRRESI